jgi:hypothetical protein
MAKTDVANKENTAVGQVLDFASDAGAGLEGVDAKSLAIPFLQVLQALSPQCEPVKDGGIEGAEAGKFINTITNELYERVLVIPAAFQRQFLRWAPNRGGFRGAYPAVDVDLNKVPGMSQHGNNLLMDVPAGETNVFDKDGRPKFDFLADTRNHFVLVQTASGGWVPALVSLTSTQIKKSKRWLSLISGIELDNGKGGKFTPPSFSHIYELTSVKEENDKGKWYGVSIKLVGQVTDAEAYNKAKKFYSDVIAGQVEVSPPVEEGPADDKEQF